MEQRPFIPRDKPKSFVVFTIAGLCGLAIGLVAFVAAGTQVRWLYQTAVALFALCWGIGAFSFVTFAIRALQGRYSQLQSRPWSDQIW